MKILTLAYLFSIGSVSGWVIEVFFRKFFSKSNPEHKWINPGFCTGPYLPIYGFGLCTLYLISKISTDFQLNLGLTVAIITLSMTAIEYIAGLIILKAFRIRLWDYSSCWGNIQGLVCPLFSFFWALLGVAYFVFIHPYILDALQWLSENLAFSFFIGFFFGVFVLDVVHSANLVSKFKKAANDSKIVLRMETMKAHIHSLNEKAGKIVHFLFFYKSDFSITDIWEKFYESFEKDKKNQTSKKD